MGGFDLKDQLLHPNWGKADEQMVYEGISQATEYFSFEWHDNIQN
jgi:hypothetical protein